MFEMYWKITNEISCIISELTDETLEHGFNDLNELFVVDI